MTRGTVFAYGLLGLPLAFAALPIYVHVPRFYAETAGMASGDEWLGVQVQGEGWRIARLEDVAFYAGAATQITAVVARDGRLLQLPMALPAALPTGTAGKSKPAGQRSRKAAAATPDTISLTATDSHALRRWLA